MTKADHSSLQLALDRVRRREQARELFFELNRQIDELSEDDLLALTLENAERLTASTIGYLHFVEADQEHLSLQIWSAATRAGCEVPELTHHYPVSEAGIWVECIRERKPVIHQDYETAPNKGGLPEGHATLTRHLGVPIFDKGQIVAVIGVGNKELPYDNEDIGIVRLLGDSMWNLVGRKRAELALAESEKLWRGMFDNNRAVQLLIDAEDGKILEANPAAADFYGYPQSMLREMRIWEINTLSEHELREKMASASSGSRFKFHFGHRLRDGTVRDVEVFSSPVSFRGRKVLYSIIIDVSERKHFQRSLDGDES